MRYLIHRLQTLGYKVERHCCHRPLTVKQAGKTLFGLPYDWRQPLRNPYTLSKLRKMLETATISSSGGHLSRADIISHGAGGLVVLSFIAANPQFAQTHIGSWTAVGCPWQGSMSAVTQLLLGESQAGNEPPWGNPYLSKETARALASQLPAVYELLPQHAWHGKDAPRIVLQSMLIPAAMLEVCCVDELAIDTEQGLETIFTSSSKVNFNQNHLVALVVINPVLHASRKIVAFSS